MSTSNRTLVSSILFLDIVEYSKQSVANQHGLKQRFNTLLGEALEQIAPSHRILLDTGDGAAISFQVNPEDPMFVAMHLRDAIDASNATGITPKLLVRFGINLGPVRLITDLNGKVNIIGDGVNSAQRVMSFAEPGAILVSRSYFEVVSHLTDDYAKLFSIAGTRTDKHVREYSVYELSKIGRAGEQGGAVTEFEIALPPSAQEPGKHAAEEKARAEDEERKRQETEEQTRRKAELDAELAAWEQTQREAEENAKREAAEKARRQAEEKARREAEERTRREAAERARAEAEAAARAEAAEKARAEAEAAELRKREAEAQRRREAELKARLAAEEQARLAAEEQSHAKKRPRRATARSARQISWGKLIILGLPLLLIVLIGALHLVPFTGIAADLERRASEQLGQPVKIESVHLSLFPPQWRLDGVTIGADAQIKVARIKASLDPAQLFGTVKSYKLVDFESVLIKPEALGWALFGRPNGQSLHVTSLRAFNIKLNSSSIDLPLFDARADIDSNGAWQKLTLENADKSLFIELHPDTPRVHFELTADNFKPPFGAGFAFNSLTGKGSFGPADISLSEFEANILGGTLRGDASLKWSNAWALEGNVTAQGISGHEALPALLESGHINARGSYAMLAADATKLFGSARINGTFSMSEGALAGVDLAHPPQGVSTGGRTEFRELTGSFGYDRGNTQLRQLHLGAGLLSAGGNVDADAAGHLRGGLTASFSFDNQRSNTSINLGGTLTAPRFSH